MFGQRGLAERLAIARATLSKLLAGHTVPIAKRRLCEVRRRIAEVRVEADAGATAREATRAAIAELIKRVGLKGAAVRLDMNASNLLKVMRGHRPPNESLIERVREAGHGA
jgi:hypothetical protein